MFLYYISYYIMDFTLNITFHYEKEYDLKKYNLSQIPGFYIIKISSRDKNCYLTFKGKVSNVNKKQLIYSLEVFLIDALSNKSWETVPITDYINGIEYSDNDRVNVDKYYSNITISTNSNCINYTYENNLNYYLTYSNHDSFTISNENKIKKSSLLLNILMEYITEFDPNILSKSTHDIYRKMSSH